MKSSKQQGQAIIEMCICLIPILVVVLGMIFIAGLGISNIRTFIQAKGNAEYNSRLSNASEVSGAGDNINYWNYGVYDPEDPFSIDKDGDGLPFTDDDKANTFNPDDNTFGIDNTEQLNNPEYSESRDSNDYYFMPTTSLVSIDNNYGTMLAAAGLVEGTADSGLNNVFTLSHTDNAGNLKLTFTHLFGIEVDALDLSGMPANKVYYPALPTEN